MNAPWREPFDRFTTLFEHAKLAQPKDPNAMTLATVDDTGRPTVRVVLLKGFDERGFVFYTNHHSGKGKDLLAQKVAGLNFYWPSMDQQVRIEGSVAPVTDEESAAYFATRHRDSQLGAWASDQSAPLPSREVLEARLAEVTVKYAGRAVPRPSHWGGFRVTPERIEFWKAHPSRLHWREEYERRGAEWAHAWLNP